MVLMHCMIIRCHTRKSPNWADLHPVLVGSWLILAGCTVQNQVQPTTSRLADWWKKFEFNRLIQTLAPTAQVSIHIWRQWTVNWTRHLQCIHFIQIQSCPLTTIRFATVHQQDRHPGLNTQSICATQYSIIYGLLEHYTTHVAVPMTLVQLHKICTLLRHIITSNSMVQTQKSLTHALLRSSPSTRHDSWKL